jgi:methyl-accepting chemotaxis protein
LVDSAYAASPEYQDFWRKLNEGQFNAGEFKRLGKGGQDVWLQASYNPIFDLNKKVTSVVKFATNITGRVRAVTEIAAGLAELADNNLQYRLSKAFEPAFEQVRSDYNASLERLEMTVSRVAASLETIQGGTAEIASSTSDMSRRIEEQAAGLEETAAALDEITGTVKQSAEGALEAALAAAGARSGTALSSKVMSQAATVMTEISESSNKITQIIGVMDEIAFQTNLLALNAGVEAARAGDSGRGFAVVAQEVRALAQRSAEAAKEIKSLISSSSAEVKRGVELVSETAAALEGVTEKVVRIDSLLSDMARAAKEQAIGLAEVNTAVNRMDVVTQQNSAMITEATGAAATLKGEAVEMADLIGQFRIGREAHVSTPAPRGRVVEPAPRPKGRARAVALSD